MKCPECGTELAGVQKVFHKVTTDLFRKTTGLRILDVFGQNEFPVYGCSGGVTTRIVFYLQRGNSVLPLWANDDLEKTILDGIKRFEKDSHHVDWNGGDLGLPKEEI